MDLIKHLTRATVYVFNKLKMKSLRCSILSLNECLSSSFMSPLINDLGVVVTSYSLCFPSFLLA